MPRNLVLHSSLANVLKPYFSGGNKNMTKTNTAKRNALQQNPGVLLLMGLVLLGATYGFASWAIDNGRISVYALTIISLFASLRFLVLGTKHLITRK